VIFQKHKFLIIKFTNYFFLLFTEL